MASYKVHSASCSRHLTDEQHIREHMATHYNRILCAKASVDCSVPKSMLSCVKYRDQLRRNKPQPEVARYEKGYNSSRSDSQSSCGYDEGPTEISQNPSILLRNEPSTDLENYVHSARSFASSKEKYSVLPSTSNIGKETIEKISSRAYSDLNDGISASQRQRHGISFDSSSTNANSQHCYRPFQDPHQKTYSGDVLEKHAHHFTDGHQPFTPRILKNEAQSFLSQYRFYTPVQKKQKSRKILIEQETQTDFDSFQDVYSQEKRNYSQLAPQQDSQNGQMWSAEELEDRKVFAHHLHSKRQKDSFEHSADNYSTSVLSLPKRMKSPIMRKIRAEEEELKYLEVISDVTKEILTLGLFSNRVLIRICERYIEQNKHRLDESKLRHLLDVLKEDLGCKPELKTWRTTGNETVEKYQRMEFNCCASKTADISTDCRSNYSWNHVFHGECGIHAHYPQNVTGNHHSHVSREQNHEFHDIEGKYSLAINNEENLCRLHKEHLSHCLTVSDEETTCRLHKEHADHSLIVSNEVEENICRLHKAHVDHSLATKNEDEEDVCRLQTKQADHSLSENHEENLCKLHEEHAVHSIDYGSVCDHTSEIRDLGKSFAECLHTAEVKEHDEETENAEIVSE
uniref:Spermatogenesis-associated protein 7 n=1 Tax=Callorhinchus milii TaxID=7868 RepID=A0A4W3H8I6_CALMI